MTDKLAVFIIATVFVLGAVVAFIFRDELLKTQTTNQNNSQQKNDQKNSNNNQNSSQSRYIDYSEEAFDQYKDKQRILFFHASWCPQCRSLDSDIKSNDLPEDVVIFKVDYDTNQTLRQKYGVTIQTTLVSIDKDGNEIDKYVAYDEPTFASVKRELIE